MRTSTSCTRRLWALVAVAFATVCALAFPAGLQAQQTNPDDIEDAAGMSYVVAFPDTTMNTFDARYPNRRYEDKAFFFIYSAVDTKLNIKGIGYTFNQPIQGGKFTIVDLMSPTNKAANPIVTVENQAVNNTFRIDADAPIIVYCYLVTKFGTEAWTAIPIDYWGTEYYAAAIPGEIGSDVSPGGEFDYNRKNKMFQSEILILAAYDDTHVTIVPNAGLHNYPKVDNVILNAGEAYQVQALVDTLTKNLGTPQGDLGGSRIFATKPIGVISGNTRAQVLDEQVGLGKNAFKNMLIEWVAPIDQHGTEFVYMPTMDGRRPTGTPGEKIDEKRKAEFMRIYGTAEGSTDIWYFEDGVRKDAPPVDQGKFTEIRVTPTFPRVFHTSKPAQAMMHSSAVVKFSGTTGSGSYIGAQYDGWGAYMVEAIGREQWISFAPYYVSTYPSGMEQFLNVVTDTLHRNDVYQKNGANIIFTKDIPGTDLTWATINVQPGVDQWLEGRNGAKFYAFVYGDYAKGGHEEYRPGRAAKDDDSPSMQSNGGKIGDPTVAHPSEYEEYLGIAYGYPLAPSRLVIGEGDSLLIKTELNCTELTVTFQALNENPVGLANISLRDAENAKIKETNPFPITAATKGYVKVAPINPLQDAKATVRLKDRTGKVTTVQYVYFAERVTLDRKDIDFGIMTPKSKDTRILLVTNPLGRPLVIKSVRLIKGEPAFKVIDPIPSRFPITLQPGEVLKVTVEANPQVENQPYNDSLEVVLECTKFKLAVLAETTNPCVYVDDLNFETLLVNQSKSLQLSIYNNGGGIVTFDNPSGGQVLEWLLANFTVSQADIDKVKAARLARGEKVTITVTFVADKIGVYETDARFWASTRNCKDVSHWTANVTQPGPQLTGYDWDQQWLVNINNCTKNTIGEYRAEVKTFNTGTSDFMVDKVEIVGPDAFAFKLGANPAIKPGDILRPGGTDERPQEVFFYPTEERAYNAKIQLITQKGDTAFNVLKGIGIETHVTITDTTRFIRQLFLGANGITADTQVVTIAALKTRDLTVTDLQITAGAPEFLILSRLDTIIGKTYPIGSVIEVTVAFHPSAPGIRSGVIEVFGDQSKCDVSTGMLYGDSYTLGATASVLTFGTRLACFDTTGNVTLKNTGTDPVKVTGMQFAEDNNTNAFSPTLPSLPLFILPGEEIQIPVRFAPTDKRQYSGSITFNVYDSAGVYDISRGVPIVAFFTGTGDTVHAPAHIGTDYHGMPGARYKIAVILDRDLTDAQIDNLTLNLYYNKGVMLDEAGADKLPDAQAITAGTILEKWKVNIVQRIPDPTDTNLRRITIQFTAPAGEYLNDLGDIANIPFVTFIGSSTESDLPFSLQATGREACVIIDPTPGHARIDSVCGLNFRLIEAFGTTYTLKQNSPNPFNPTTNINFSLGLDGPTTLVVYDAAGHKVATLIDETLAPGTYTVTWDATEFPSGLYYYRLNSGDWTRTNTMMLTK